MEHVIILRKEDINTRPNGDNIMIVPEPGYSIVFWPGAIDELWIDYQDIIKMRPEQAGQDLKSEWEAHARRVSGLILTDPIGGGRLYCASDITNHEDGSYSFEVANRLNTRRWKHTIKTEEV